MHRFWDIPELVKHLIELLDLKDQATVARACRLLWLHAVSCMWGDVENFIAFVKLLPQDAVHVDGSAARTKSFTLERPLQDADWERFLLHSQHTKSLGVLFADKFQQGYQQLVDNLPSQPVFPKLTNIRLSLSSGSIAMPSPAVYSFFIPQSTSNLKIFADYQCETAAKAVLGTVSLPKLDYFAFRTGLARDNPQIEYGPMISNAILAHTTIKALEVELNWGGRFSDVIKAAGLLPHLIDISLISQFSRNTIDNIDPQLQSSQDNSFAKVRKVKVTGSKQLMDLLLRRPGPSNMDQVVLDFDIDPTEDQLKECLHSISHFTRLKVLELTVRGPISWNSIGTGLNACRDLKTFTAIAAEASSLDLTEEAFERMATSWPLLQDLTLCVASDPSSYAKQCAARGLRLRHLVMIASKFFCLRRLRVSVDATKEKNSRFSLDGLSGLDAVNRMLVELDVEGSPVSLAYADLIASLLRATWPKLSAVRFHSRSAYGWAWGRLNDRLVN